MPSETQVSKPKVAVVHAKVLLMLRVFKIHAKETQVSEPKVAVIQAKIFAYA